MVVRTSFSNGGGKPVSTESRITFAP